MSQTVLVADDSKTIRQIVEMALKASSWEVVGVGNAQDAVQAARQNPSVILLDYYMPDGSGYDICRQLKSDASTRSIPVVMLGGSYKSFDESLARESGADAVLMKPFKTDALFNALEEAQTSAATPSAPAPEAAPPAVPEPELVAEPEAAVYEIEESEPGYGAASEPSEVEEEIVIGAPDEEPPAFTPPSPTPVPQAASQAPPRVPADATPIPQAASQPRIPIDPPQARHGSTPDINASSRQGAAPVTPAAPAAMSRSDIESYIKEEVKATVRNELPGLLRTVMGEIFQNKVLPKLVDHADQRVRAAVAENLTSQIQHQVRAELERLLNEE